MLLLCLLLSFCFDWEDISNTRDSVIGYPNTSIFIKTTSLHSLLGVWISRWNTVPRVWYITPNIFQNLCVAFISPTEDLKSSFTEPTIFTKTNTGATLPRTLAKPEGRTIQKIFCLLQNGKTTFSPQSTSGWAMFSNHNVLTCGIKTFVTDAVS